MPDAIKMAEAIQQGMTENPTQWAAFLAGLEAGYQLGAAARRPAPQEGQSK